MQYIFLLNIPPHPPTLRACVRMCRNWSQVRFTEPSVEVSLMHKTVGVSMRGST